MAENENTSAEELTESPIDGAEEVEDVEVVAHSDDLPSCTANTGNCGNNKAA